MFLQLAGYKSGHIQLKNTKRRLSDLDQVCSHMRMKQIKGLSVKNHLDLDFVSGAEQAADLMGHLN